MLVCAGGLGRSQGLQGYGLEVGLAKKSSTEYLNFSVSSDAIIFKSTSDVGNEVFPGNSLVWAFKFVIVKNAINI